MTSFELADSIQITPEEDWAAAVKLYKTVRLTDDLFAKSLTGNDLSGNSKCKGVYRWIYEGDIIYIGKAGRMNTVALRQSAHLTSFRNPKVTAESSGKKLREFLTSNHLNEMTIKIEYVNMSHCKDATIDLFETSCIAFYNPLLNFGE